jgi:hypothetical protein
VAPSLQGLNLRDLQRTGVLTKVFTGVSEVGHGLAMRKRTQREVPRSGGPCGAASASVPLPVAVAAPLPQRPVGRGRGTLKQGSGERMGHKLIEMDKTSEVAGEVQFIGARTGADTSGVLASLRRA